jgi:hypothetical protein
LQWRWLNEPLCFKANSRNKLSNPNSINYVKRKV